MKTVQILPGLTPEPLASYLAGLGLISVLGDQADPGLTAHWSPNGLAITTRVEDIAAWLADEYMPALVLSPWNNGSGFGLKDREPITRLNALREHPSPRLAPYRDAIRIADGVVREARDGGWDDNKKRVVLAFHNRCPEKLLPWIDASVVLADDDTFFPPLLGTGGNDGRLDFSTNFHQRLIDLLGTSEKDRASRLASARDLLHGTENERLARAAIGQFNPGGAGGPGSSRFGAADTLVNPWGYVLLVEGALLFASSAVRRNQFAAGRAAMPFTVMSSPDGFASSADGEESRGEVWAPLWKDECTLAEIAQLFAEARVSWRGKPARRAVHFYAATRTLGVSRGIDEFVRYGLQQRNGLAFAAVPLARVKVRERAEVRLVADVEDWASRVAGDASAAVAVAARRFQRAQLEYARDGGALPLARMLAALTDLELAVGRSGRARENNPVRYAPPAGKFLEVLRGPGGKTETPELRVAVGIASCATLPGAGSGPRTMRQILLPVDPGDPGDKKHRSGRWRDTPVVPGFGIRRLEDVLADVAIWRSRTAPAENGQVAFRGVPSFREGIPVPAADLHDFATGRLDDRALDLYLRACLALNWRNADAKWTPGLPAVPVATLGFLHALACGMAPGDGDRDDSKPADEPALALNPDWPVRLAAGQVRGVHEEARARLRQAGWDTFPMHDDVTYPNGTRLAAALVPRCLHPRPILRTLAVQIKRLNSGEET